MIILKGKEKIGILDIYKISSKDIFEPEEIEEKFATEEDKKIKEADIPERL